MYYDKAIGKYIIYYDEYILWKQLLLKGEKCF